ncbi:MAG: hypothetical protein H5T61_15800 [Thermoflexales bacterium]|nr:hypothetical protein [Thermoflexales bacterium]
MKVVRSFTLDTEEHRDILAWLDAQPNQSEAIRQAIREHIRRGGVTLADVYQAVRDLERRIGGGGVVAAGPSDPASDEPEEPPDLAAALDALARL